jgi:DnaJ family protein C protein 28
VRKQSSSIDEIIRDAMQRGEFDNLPGKGKPLNLDKNPYEDPEWGLAYNLIKSSGFTLPWMERRKDIEELLQSARKDLIRTYQWTHQHIDQYGPLFQKEWDAALLRFKERITDLNKLIKDYNLEVPSTQFQIKQINAERVIMQVETGKTMD